MIRPINTAVQRNLSFKGYISPEYIGLISKKISNVQMETKAINEKIDETKQKKI